MVPVTQALAASLASCDWTVEAITLHLATRLPARYRDRAARIARDLKAAYPRSASPGAALIATALRSHDAMQAIVDFSRRTAKAPDLPLAPPAFHPAPALQTLALPALATTADLADWLHIPPEALVRFADLRRLSALSASHFGPHYHHHLIPKRSGALRLIEEPKPFLKRLQRLILHGILNRAPPHAAAHGFTQGRSCLTAAARHAGEQVVLCFDLRDFFPSVTYTRVFSIFRTLGYPHAVAQDLTGLCTAVTPPEVLAQAGATQKARHLPQGAPTSPALANLAAYQLDCRLAGLAHRLGARYTRYADDLTFSGDSPIAAALGKWVPEIARDEGFPLNPAKTRVSRAGRRQLVTGTVVNQHLNVPREDYDRLRATLHHLGRPTDPRRADAAFLTRLAGRIAWVEQVNPHRGLKLRLAFDAL